jgi:hypothetical protein
MDLNYELNELRRLAKEIKEAPLNANRDGLIEKAYEMAGKFLELDEAIRDSEMVPYEWSYATV